MRNKAVWLLNGLLILVLATILVTTIIGMTSSDDADASKTTTTTTEPSPVEEWVPDGPNAAEIKDAAEEAGNLRHFDNGGDWELGIVREPMEQTMSVITATETILLQGKFSGCRESGENLATDYFRGLFTPDDLVLWSHEGGDNVICGQEIHLVHER